MIMLIKEVKYMLFAIMKKALNILLEKALFSM